MATGRAASFASIAEDCAPLCPALVIERSRGLSAATDGVAIGNWLRYDAAISKRIGRAAVGAVGIAGT